MNNPETYSLHMGTDVCCRILDVDPNLMLKSAQLDHLVKKGEDIRVTADQYFHAWNMLTQLTDHEDFITRLGVTIARGPIIPVFFALTCAPNMEVGLTRLSRYKTLLGPTNMRVDIEESEVRVAYNANEPHLTIPPGLAALHLVFIVEALRLAMAYDVKPLAATLDACAEDRESVSEHLGVVPKLDNITGLTFSRKDAIRPFISENSRLWQDFEGDLDVKLSEQNASFSIATQVRTALIELFPTGRANADAVCSTLSISRRTLQRRLIDEGTSFQKLLSDTRRELAIRYLTKSNFKVSEIAQLLSYSDANSFSRSFRKWTKVSPADFRKQSST